MTVAQALKQPDAKEWQRVTDKEEARLLMNNTWTDATDEEIQSAERILPIVIILTIKRSGDYKARACVLGNLGRGVSGLDVFAPVVGHGANRLLCTTAAAASDNVCHRLSM